MTQPKHDSSTGDIEHVGADGIESISTAEEAWFFEQLELIRSLAADEEPSDAPVAHAGAPIAFVDFDHVLCLCRPFGMYDALDLVNGKHPRPDLVRGLLMHVPAVAALREMYERMGGRLRYVVSSTWRQHFTRAQLRHLLRQVGLAFVADNIESRERWCTPSLSEPDRRIEVGAWLEQHHAGEPYVVLDDDLSGASLASSPAYSRRVTMCRDGAGLQHSHVDQIVCALTAPIDPSEPW